MSVSIYDIFDVIEKNNVPMHSKFVDSIAVIKRLKIPESGEI